MYLLEHIQNSLTGSKHQLALQLMHKPWMCERKLLVEYIPAQLVKQFLKLQESCETALHTPAKKARFFQTELTGVALRAYVMLPDGRRSDLDAMTKHLVGQFAGQVREDLAAVGASFQGLSDAQQKAFIALYMLADASLFLLAGIVDSKSPHTMTLTQDAATLRGYRLYWFGHHWATQSNTSDMFLRHSTVQSIRRQFGSIENAVRMNSPIFTSFVNASLDKFLTIHANFSHLLEIKDHAIYAAMYRKAELISYLFLKSHESTDQLQAATFNPISDITIPGDIDISLIAEAGFSQLDFEKLLAESSKQIPGDALLLNFKNGKIKLGDISFKYACNVYLKSMLSDLTSRGAWFDKKYIPAYLSERVKNKRYTYGACIQPKTVEEGKYDVDLIIADHDTERIYLCQIKHRATTMLPYLRDELKEFSINGQLIGATDQLNGARHQLSSKKFLEKVRDSLKRGGISAGFLAKIDTPLLQKQAGFIIIHTIENLDFGLKEGIALYEWNTFRNLLRGNISTYSNNQNGVAHLDLVGVPLDDPERVSEQLIEWLEKRGSNAFGSPNTRWELKKSSYLQMTSQWHLKLCGRSVYSLRWNDFRYPLP